MRPWRRSSHRRSSGEAGELNLLGPSRGAVRSIACTQTLVLVAPNLPSLHRAGRHASYPSEPAPPACAGSSIGTGRQVKSGRPAPVPARFPTTGCSVVRATAPTSPFAPFWTRGSRTCSAGRLRSRGTSRCSIKRCFAADIMRVAFEPEPLNEPEYIRLPLESCSCELLRTKHSQHPTGEQYRLKCQKLCEISIFYILYSIFYSIFQACIYRTYAMYILLRFKTQKVLNSAVVGTSQPLQTAPCDPDGLGTSGRPGLGRLGP